ncbi:MAG: acetyl-CoA carboxylase biotin carboxyl carrier protein [Rhodospirillaceae bacterium]|nr:acetyl-CoA carboxylase biotin carboxyl carrier protein [Rhodospirillaceae bacterium]
MNKKIDVDDKLIKKLAKLLDETGLAEIEYGEGDVSIRVSKGGTMISHSTGPAPAALQPVAVSAESAPADVSHAEHPGVVTSPMVGVVYTSPEPGAAAFINVGDSVTAGQVVMLIEAMKVFNQIKAPKSGKVTKILVEGGSPVEFGEPLLIVE